MRHPVERADGGVEIHLVDACTILSRRVKWASAQILSWLCGQTVFIFSRSVTSWEVITTPAPADGSPCNRPQTLGRCSQRGRHKIRMWSSDHGVIGHAEQGKCDDHADGDQNQCFQVSLLPERHPFRSVSGKSRIDFSYHVNPVLQRNAPRPAGAASPGMPGGTRLSAEPKGHQFYADVFPGS